MWVSELLPWRGKRPNTTLRFVSCFTFSQASKRKYTVSNLVPCSFPYFKTNSLNLQLCVTQTHKGENFKSASLFSFQLCRSKLMSLLSHYPKPSTLCRPDVTFVHWRRLRLPQKGVVGVGGSLQSSSCNHKSHRAKTSVQIKLGDLYNYN